MRRLKQMRGKSAQWIIDVGIIVNAQKKCAVDYLYGDYGGCAEKCAMSSI